MPVPAPTREEEERERAAIEEKLAAFVPATLAERGVEVQVEVVTGFNPAEMISQAAERLESDVICLSTHGRSGISKAILGSVAEALVRRATVPVLIVPPHWMQ